MSSFSVDAKNSMLDGLSPDSIQLHNGDPGESGADNQIGSAESASFSPAANGKRELQSAVQFLGLTPFASVTWISIWGGSDFIAKSEITGETAANASGEFKI